MSELNPAPNENVDQPVDRFPPLFSRWFVQNFPWLEKLNYSKTVWIVAILLVAIFRMWLVGKDGIIPIKYDSRNYTLTSHYLLEPGSGGTMTTHRPGMPIVAWMSTQIGLPYKVFLDGMLILLAAFAGITAHRLMDSFLGGLSVFLAIAINPWFVMLSQTFMTEPLTALLIMSIMLFSIQMLIRPISEWSVVQVVLAGVATATFNLTRNEGPLLLLFWVAVLIVVMIRQRKEVFSLRLFRSPRNVKLLLVAVPVVMSFFVMQWLKQHNGEKYGVPAICCTEAEGFTSLMDALYSIDPELKLRYAPVTTGAVERACEVSPTLNKYRSRLLDSTRSSFFHCKKRTGYENQFGTWMNWHLIDSFSGVNQVTDKEMLKAAEEIRAAQDRGDLPKRFGKFPIHPVWQEWLPDIPERIWPTFKHSLFVQTNDNTQHLYNERLRDSADEAIYDSTLLRRNGVGITKEVHISGRMKKKPECVSDLVRLFDKDGTMIATVPVVEDDYAEKLFVFSIVLNEIECERIQGPLTLRFIDNDSSSGRFWSNLILAKNTRMWANQVVYSPINWDETSGEYTGEKPVDETWYISTVRHKPDRGERKQLKQKIIKYYRWMIWLTLAGGLISGILFRGPRQQFWDVVWVAIAALVFVVARNMLYALLDAWVGWGIHRYVEPNNLLFLFGLTCTAFVVGRQLVRFFGVEYPSDAL